MKISELMTKSPATCELTTSIEEIARQMTRSDCGSLPVIESNRIVGLITDRDIVIRSIAAGKCPLELSAQDLMSHPVVTIGQDETIQDAMKALEFNQIRRLPVVDSNSRLVGIVSVADLARVAGVSEAGTLVQSITSKMSLGHE
jgi:CBS domain-containing protein